MGCANVLVFLKTKAFAVCALRPRSVECGCVLFGVLEVTLDKAVVEVGRTDMLLCFPLFAVAQRTNFLEK